MVGDKAGCWMGEIQVSGSKAYQRIVESVERELAGGQLQAGDRLASEREMVARFGVSRTSVREALRVLENSGLVRSRHGDRSGPVVLDPAVGPLADTITRIARLRGCTAGELVGYRMMLESTANQLAASLRTDEQLVRMRQSLEAMRVALDAGPSEFGEADFDFHEVVAKASHNSLIEHSLRAAKEAAVTQIGEKIVSAPNRRRRMEQSLAVHQDVYAAIERGDGAKAADIARRSIFETYQEYLETHEVRALGSMCD